MREGGRWVRVLHVSQPVTGGVAVVVRDLVAHQQRRGYDVQVASPPGQLPDQLAGTTQWHPWVAEREPGRAILRESRHLARIVAEVDPDVVHLHSAKAGLCGRLAVRGRRPTVFQPHGWSFLAVGGVAALGARVWERRGARWAQTLVCVSTAEQREGERAGVRHGRFVVCPNGVHVEGLGAQPRRVARRALGLPEGVPLVLCVARLSHQKGIDLMLDAWRPACAAHPDARLLLVGDGPERDEVERRARSMGGSVVLAGPRDDVPLWYSAADLVVLPSRYEGMALTPLEAMASGRSVVGFDVPGFAESLAETDEPDLVLPVGDVTPWPGR